MIPDRPISVKISGATTADAEDIASLLRASWAATYGSLLTPDELNTVAREWHHPDIVRRQIANPAVLFLVARADTRALVGIVTAKPSGDETVSASILRLYVLPDYQGQGIGSQLLAGALAAFPKARRIQLQVVEGNASGLSFWTKRGFRACGHDETRVGDTTLALISMERTVGDPKDLVRDSYDRISHAYRGDTLPGDRGYFRWLDLLRPYLHQGDAVLDLGCGCGVPMAQELAQFCHVTGIDISPVQIERARKLVPSGTFECRDMAGAEFEEGRFTAIVSLFAIFHLPVQEHRPLLARMFSWLRPGGYLLISLGHSAWTGYEEDWYGAPMYWSHADEQTSLKWLEEVGFEMLWQEFLPEGKGGHRIVLARRSS